MCQINISKRNRGGITIKVLFTLKYEEDMMNRVRDLGYEVVFNTEGKKSNLANLSQEELDSIDVLVTYNSFGKLDISKMNNLKFIQLASTGFDQFPVDKIANKDIILSNNKGGYSIPIAEWIVMMVLQTYKNTYGFYEKQKNKEWKTDFSVEEIYGKKIGFIGTGTIALEAAKRLKAFGVEIWGCNTDGRGIKYFDRCFSIETMEELFENCDIIVSTMPLTNKTIKIINKDKFKLMKEGASFINVGRGQVIDEDDLIEFAHKFRCIVLDVFNEDTLPKESKLWDLDNIIITPHNSWVSQNNNVRTFNLFYNNLKKFIQNKQVDNMIDLNKGY